MSEKQRYTVLDILRGIAIICMVVYHTMWDLVFIHDVDFQWFRSDAAELFQESIRWSFLLLSGFCWSLGRNHIKRSLTVLAGSAAVSIVTAIFTPENTIIYGVLTLIGLGMLITVPLDKLFRKISPYIGIIACAVLFIITFYTEEGSFGIGKLVEWELPRALYANYFTAILGFKPRSFSSPDYVPLLPWIFLFWAGYFLYHIFRRRQWLKYLSVISFGPLEWLGRHSLIIYMLHQPIVYGVLLLFFNFIF